MRFKDGKVRKLHDIKHKIKGDTKCEVKKLEILAIMCDTNKAENTSQRNLDAECR